MAERHVQDLPFANKFVLFNGHFFRLLSVSYVCDMSYGRNSRTRLTICQEIHFIQQTLSAARADVCRKKHEWLTVITVEWIAINLFSQWSAFLLYVACIFGRWFLIGIQRRNCPKKLNYRVNAFGMTISWEIPPGTLVYIREMVWATAHFTKIAYHLNIKWMHVLVRA